MQPAEITTDACGTCDERGLFTLSLCRPVSRRRGDRLTMEVTSARIPPTRTTGCDLSFEWRAEARGPGSDDVYTVSIHRGRIYFRQLESDAIFTAAILMGDQGSAANPPVPPVIADVVGLRVQDPDARSPGYYWSLAEGHKKKIIENCFEGTFFTAAVGEDCDEEGEDYTDFSVRLFLEFSHDLALHTGWPIVTEITEARSRVPRLPRSVRWRRSCNLFCAGVEESRFQGTVTRPYVDSFRFTRKSLDTMGATLFPRSYTRELRYGDGQLEGDIRQVKMWIEDEYDDRHVFPCESLLCVEIVWRVYRPDELYKLPDQDPIEGFVVLQFDGEGGTWDMGGPLDFSGWGRMGAWTEPREYEVALLTMAFSISDVSADGLRAMAGIGVEMPGFLADDNRENNMGSLIWGAGGSSGRSQSNDILLEATIPRYKRIAPMALRQMQVKFHALRTSVSPPDHPLPFTVRRSKVILHIRRRENS